MTIALVRQRYTAFGGAERFVERAIEALGREEVKLTLLTREWNGTPAAHLSIRRLDPFYLGRTWRDWSFARAVQREIATQSYDLVQSHERIPGCAVYRAGDGTHLGWLNHRAQAAGRTFSRAGLGPYHRYVLRAEAAMFRHPALRAVICNSRMIQQEIQELFGLPEERLPLVYNGVDLQRFIPVTAAERAAGRQRLGLPPDLPLLLFVGSGFERKGLGPLLDALPPAVRLAVVGRDRAAGDYERQAARRGLTDRVVFVGPQADVRPWYGAADAFVFPTVYEPFGNVVLEAMAGGLPVLTTRQNGAAELIEDGRSGFLCDAFRPGDLAAALSRLMGVLQDPGQAAALGRAARERAEAHSLEAMGKRLVELYRQWLA